MLSRTGKTGFRTSRLPKQDELRGKSRERVYSPRKAEKQTRNEICRHWMEGPSAGSLKTGASQNAHSWM